MPAMTVSPARAVAYAVVQRVFDDGAWADRALVGEARRAGLEGRDRALATQLAFGTIQRSATLDHVIAQLAGRRELDPPLRHALRLGLFQIAYLDRVPDHAAVAESVELAKDRAPRGAGLVNAVLRRATREARALIAALPEETPEQAALKHSHPAWVARLWWEQLGPEAARALMAAGNEPPEPAVRANTLKTSREALAAALPVPSRPAPGLPEALVLEAPFDVHGSELHAAGHFVAQSRAAQAVAHIVAPAPGDTVLDLCAAPGGKATHLAALGARVTAVEKDPKRAEHLRVTAARLGADIDVVCADARQVGLGGLSPQSHVLVDPPCTDLGTLALRPDARWRKQAADPERLARLQREILEAGLAALAPGGTLVYSTCTISPAENERQVAALLADHPELELDPARPPDRPVWDHPSVAGVTQTLPHRDGTDGFFIARLVKE
jgi:16S rRNA (cytosine967-C5)-methyltransferase